MQAKRHWLPLPLAERGHVMFRNMVRALSLVLSLVLLLTVGGVWAAWMYGMPPEPQETDIPVKLSNFQYADIYIIKIEPKGTGLTKTGHTTVQGEVTGNASFEVTFYNGSNVTYYYNEAQTLSGGASYSVNGIEQKDPVESTTYKTITVDFSTGGSAEIFFHFVVDKDSIGEVVASTAVDRFREILNTDADYTFLTNAMDEDDDDKSKVTYIGNVAGADSGDSATINTLFGDEFMSMDLDGDGDTEPITMMIKREDLDGNGNTGASYSYTSGWFNPTTTTVTGAEMTLYITAQDLSNVRSGAEISVYAAVFTKYPGETEWVELVPLTKGVADANNYNGWGSSANSFNTDTWVSDGGQTLRQIVAAQN